MMEEIADFLFSIFISYVGALEFLYVVRHLYHWSFRHDAIAGSSTSAESLRSFQDSLRAQLAEATEREQRSGHNAMQDGVLYLDGFRIDPSHETQEQMLNDPEAKERRRKEIEDELERQRKIQEDIKKQLEVAEKALEDAEKQKAAEAEALAQQKAAEAEAEALARQEKLEQEENEKRLIALEKAKEEEQKLLEMARQKAEIDAEALAQQKAAEAEAEALAQQELQQKLEQEENEKRLFALEKAKEEEQKLLDLEQERLENERKLLEMEKSLEEDQKLVELQQETEEDLHLRLLKEEEDALEFARQLIARERLEEEALGKAFQHEGSTSSEDLSERETIKQMLRMEQMSPERKQHLIEENARRFLEAEQEMVDLLETRRSPVQEPIIQKVKTQFGQTSAEPFASSSKSLLFKSISDEESSNEPRSSQQSSLSTQASDEMRTTGPEDSSKNYPQSERQEPDGEDNIPDIQYTDEYLRSLDGIKHRPLVREDGSGRRRAFKKRRSSGSSNSSRDSRTSRDEELKMFTSLEEEEMQNLQKPDSDFAPIKYTSEPNLKVKAHHRRHKRSPAKDNKALEESLKASLEMLGEETTNPWGEVVPEHYKNTDFWKREKAMSIDEEEIEIDMSSVSPELLREDPTEDHEDELSRLNPKTSSFEEATEEQNQEAATSLQQQQKGNEDLGETQEESSTAPAQTSPTDNDNNKNLQASSETEVQNRSARSSPRLRRSPRIGEHMDEYEDQYDETSASKMTSPIISIQKPADEGSWRDEHGLMVEGLSDFYDFTASVNPSRSRPTSRAPSPSLSPIDDPVKSRSTSRAPSPSLSPKEDPVKSRSTSRATSPRLSPKVDPVKSRSTSRAASPSVETSQTSSAASARLSPSQNPAKSRTASPQSPSLSKASSPSKQKPEESSSPSISIHQPVDEGPWTDERGFLFEGISDFYDFTSSINPSRSRSRSTSRAPSPSPSAKPKNVNFSNHEINLQQGNFESLEALKEHLTSLDKKYEENFSETEVDQSMDANPPDINEIAHLLDSSNNDQNSFMSEMIRNVADNPERPLSPREIVPMVFINDQTPSDSEMASFQYVERPARDRYSRSRSRSPSPLPTDRNIVRSLQSRQEKRIKYNDEIFEKLKSSSKENSVERSHEANHSNDERSKSPEPSVSSPSNLESKISSEVEQNSKENMSLFVESLRVERARSRSRSRSPLPTPKNLDHSLEARQKKRIQHNDELFEKLESPKNPALEREEMTSLIENLRAERVRSSRSRTPLPPSMLAQQSLQSFDHHEANEETSSLVEMLRVERDRCRSRSPMPSGRVLPGSEERHPLSFPNPTICIEFFDNSEQERTSTSKSKSPEQDLSSLVANLRLQRSRSRSKSPMRLPSAGNLANSLEARKKKLIDFNDHIKEHLEERAKTPEPPRLTVEYVYEFAEEDSETSKEKPRERQSRSRTPSRSPPPASENISEEYPQADEEISKERQSRSGSPSRSPPPGAENISEKNPEAVKEKPTERQSRSGTPSRSPPLEEEKEFAEQDSKASSYSNLSAMDNLSDYLDFHMMLNLEASEKRTLVKTSEELETCLASKQFEIDIDSLEKMKTANDEIELRTGSPKPLQTQADRLRLLKCTPTTPDYNKTMSEEWLDSQRIKNDLLARNFKRSTYVGESMDLGAEYEPLRREAALFQRSRTPSPSIHVIDNDLEKSRRYAAEAREVQSQILNELTSTSVCLPDDSEKHGAKPKVDLNRSSNQLNLEDLRRQTAEFRRSRSKSRSPMGSVEKSKQISLDEMEINTKHFKEFSRHLNVDFLESERRASDSALFQKPEVHIQLQESEEMEPEEYHHYRRFSLAQEQQVEEYPNDDFIYVSQIEVQTPKGTRTWLQEDFYSEHLETLNLQLSEALDAEETARQEEENPFLRNDDDSNGSEDERRTVVEVEDEIEEDLADYNERGTTDESHHEISECEEADREQDRFAGRGAQDWQNADNVNAFFDYGFENPPAPTPPSLSERGAIGGPQTLAYDSDSFAIDEIYEEAIKNRKQSGILRDYDCILKEMSNSFLDKGSQISSNDSDSDRERYALWAKTRALEKANHIELARSFLEQERKENEIRYLGDAEATARQSARLRSRYGFQPVLPGSNLDDIEVDLSYKPKREYNWRKNFKLDEEVSLNSNDLEGEVQRDLLPEEGKALEISSDPQNFDKEDNNLESLDVGMAEIRKFSLGGESITLFSRSPDREVLPDVPEESLNENQDPEELKEQTLPSSSGALASIATGASKEKLKKKKSKKKTRKEMKAQEELFFKDEDEDSEGQLYSRRSSSIQMDTDSPKRSSRSRRNSKASTEDSSLLFSPRSSVGLPEPIWDITEEYVESTTVMKKKTKKRKKVKSEKIPDHYSPVEMDLKELPPLQISEALTVSCDLATDSSNGYILASLSPQISKCVTPPSEESDTNLSKEPDSRDESVASLDSSVSNTSSFDKAPNESSASSASLNENQTTRTFSSIDTFDILKDGNFYPLF